MAIIYGTTCVDTVKYNDTNVSMVTYNGTCVFPDKTVVKVHICPLTDTNYANSLFSSGTYPTSFTYEPQTILCVEDTNGASLSYSIEVCNRSRAIAAQCNLLWDRCYICIDGCIGTDNGYMELSCTKACLDRRTLSGGCVLGTRYSPGYYNKETSLTDNTEYSIPSIRIPYSNSNVRYNLCSPSYNPTGPWQLSYCITYDNETTDPETGITCWQFHECTVCGYAYSSSGASTYVGSNLRSNTCFIIRICGTKDGVFTCTCTAMSDVAKEVCLEFDS